MTHSLLFILVRSSCGRERPLKEGEVQEVNTWCERNMKGKESKFPCKKIE